MLVLGTIFKSFNKSSSPEVYIHPASPPWGSSEEGTTTVLGGFSKPKPGTSGGKWLSNAIKTQPIVKSLVFCSQKMDNRMWNKFLKTPWNCMKLYLHRCWPSRQNLHPPSLASKSPSPVSFGVCPKSLKSPRVPAMHITTPRNQGLEG